jgi:hypothetical protein
MKLLFVQVSVVEEAESVSQVKTSHPGMVTQIEVLLLNQAEGKGCEVKAMR